MKMTAKELEELLLTLWKYKPAQVSEVAQKLLAMDADLILALEEYVESGEFQNKPQYFGLSPDDISKNYPFKPPAVFLCLDWIRRDPQNALDALVEEYKKPLPKTFDVEKLKEYLEQKKSE